MLHKPTIALASDHAGFRYKEIIENHLRSHGHEVIDFGTHSSETVDYPDYVHPAAEAVASGKADLGIVLGGSGNGEAMAANKVRGVRCGVCWNEESARLTKLHNNANVISLGERLIPEDKLIAVVETWLNTTFEGGRHEARIQKLNAL